MSSSSKSTATSPTISERLAQGILACTPADYAGTRAVTDRLLLDIAGLCLAARGQTYVKAALAALDGDGNCTVIGFPRKLTAEGAAFVNGIASHGEDFDDTYEGGPVHAGVVIIPALLAAAERHQLSGADLLRGVAVGLEVMCRLCKVAPMRVHKAGFHPTAIFGVMGAVAGIGAALRLSEEEFVNAFGIAGSMAGGLIEYLADGSWTKRMHPGWAAQSGYRAVRLAQGGFVGPRTVFEGHHGLFHGFANTLEGNFEAMMDGFGKQWLCTTIAFKPYACGTMSHPYIDCGREFRARNIDPEQIATIEAETAEGIVHRLWEPLAMKQSPPNGYAAKFSTPYAIAAGILKGDAGLGEYDEDVVKDPAMTRLAGKVSYIIDPANPYPNQFTGHLRVTLKNGEVYEHRQGYFKGGAEHPLSDNDIQRKFVANCVYGGLTATQAQQMADVMAGLLDQPRVDLSRLPA
ncbi:MmgE/PrpD family protein [Polaromonas sp. YR568]|uniref:MmgE/PrpD family protein n=1 Tax=Polaromonas sp. YR568 TaxID=1855301 RepID=UPI00398BD5DE